MKKKIIVQKYGGSSVSDIDKIKKVARIVCNTKDAGYDVAVVVSAMGKTTDQLLTFAKSISNNPHRRELDMLLSAGERISMSLLSIAIQQLGYEAISLTGSQSGIITNDRHSDAKIIEVRPIRVEDELEKGKIVIVAGYQGMSYKREITTLGRGGSDTTAVALAAALEAERCEIYSDIDGVYSADPATVAEAKHLPKVSYQEMQEMAMAGAKVLAADAVEFAKQSKIAIYCRATFSPGKETIVRKEARSDVSEVKALVYEKDIARIRVRSDFASEKFSSLLSCLEEEQVGLKELNQSVPLNLKIELNENPVALKNWARGNFVISLKNVHTWSLIKEKILKLCKDELEIDENLGAVSLIGEGINRDNRTLLKLLGIMNELNIPVCGITTTSFRISILVPKERTEEIVKVCHKRFIN